MNTRTLDQIKNDYYGQIGTPERDRIERELEALRIGFKIRSAREKKKMTQAKLAERIDKKRTFISKIENDGENITLKTLFDVVERGLGGKLKIDIVISTCYLRRLLRSFTNFSTFDLAGKPLCG